MVRFYDQLAALEDAEMVVLTRWALDASRGCDRDGRPRLRAALVALAGVLMAESEVRARAVGELEAMGFEW